MRCWRCDVLPQGLDLLNLLWQASGEGLLEALYEECLISLCSLPFRLAHDEGIQRTQLFLTLLAVA